MKIQLNCDMGEGFGLWKMGNDELLMPHIDMANLACGFHASDPITMTKSVLLAKKHHVIIGAHPGYHDLEGFGRRSISHTKQEIKALVLYQIGALDAICKANDTEVSYVKPHGALYNDMMKNEDILDSIMEALSCYNQNIKLMILSTTNNDHYKNLAQSYGIELLFELFADRNYCDDGSLVPRLQSNAVIHDSKTITKRINDIKTHGYIKSINNQKLYLQSDTICVHGDNDNAVEFVQILKKVIE
ncbi:MAG: 5-oxoprolinase subunit PxpA [Campylobacterota bacterium]|nr:5-oxoprolinase subunit PxpA [Campylobacterota bacterium]